MPKYTRAFHAEPLQFIFNSAG